MRKNDTKSDSTNPADIIAKALREKFQNSNLNYHSPGNFLFYFFHRIFFLVLWWKRYFSSGILFKYNALYF